MSDPPSTRTIQAEIEGLPEGDVLEAPTAVLDAGRTGHGADDLYENFCRNL